MSGIDSLRPLRLELPTFESQSPDALKAVVAKLGRGPSQRPGAVSGIRIRSFAELRETVLAGDLASIRLGEWLMVLRDRLNWAPDEAIVSAPAIWQHALTERTLLTMLMIRMTQSVEETVTLDRPLIDGYQRVKPDLIRLNRDLVVVIDSLTMGPDAPARLAALTQVGKLSPRQLLTRFNLSPDLRVVQMAYPHCLERFLAKPEPTHESWIIACLEELTPSACRDAVARFLAEIRRSELERLPVLVRWIRDRFGPSQAEHGSLDQATRQRLRDLIGAITYLDFEKLVRTLKARYGSTWAEYEMNRLLKRCAFWSNYQDSFLDLKVFLPSDVKEDLDLRGLAPSAVVALDDSDIEAWNHTQPTEVCVFETERYLLIEFFRGNGSETAIIRADDEAKKYLMGSNDLSVKKIRRYIAGKNPMKLDHVFLWQGNSERKLYELGIVPSKQDRFCMTLGGETRAYNPRTGIEGKQDAKSQQDRNFKLRDWRREIEQLYEEAVDPD